MRSCIIQQIQDQAGRWSGNIYQLKTGMKLALISFYQVVKHNTNEITSVHSQQIAWLHKCGWLEDPKTAMLRDLKVALQTPQQDNVMIIVGGDFNEKQQEPWITLYAGNRTWLTRHMG
jgi:hypothetical protein